MKNSQKLAERIGEVQSRYVQAYLEGWEGYLSLVSDLVRNPGSPQDAQPGWASAGSIACATSRLPSAV